MKRILVPIDFSEESKNALNVASQIARKSGASIILLHVLEDVIEQSYNVTGEMDLANHTFDNVYFIELYKKVKKDLEELVNLKEYADINIKKSIQTGLVFQHLEDCIEKEHIDLVVMGSKGASGFKEMLLGSNAEKVVRYAKCPVLTIKNKVDISKFKNILFATDLYTKQSKIIDELKKFLSIFDLKLYVLKINIYHNWVTDRDMLKELNDFIAKHDLKNAIPYVFDDTYLEDGIVRFAEEANVDIIAMGTHGRSGLAHIIAGSVAEDLVNHASRPVWTCNY